MRSARGRGCPDVMAKGLANRIQQFCLVPRFGEESVSPYCLFHGPCRSCRLGTNLPQTLRECFRPAISRMANFARYPNSHLHQQALRLAAHCNNLGFRESLSQQPHRWYTQVNLSLRWRPVGK